VIINYRIANGAGGYILLLDPAQGGTLELWNPKASTHPQIEELASNYGQGASVFTNSLGNIRETISMRGMNIVYTDAAAALTASRTLKQALLNQLVHLQVIESNGQTAETQYFPNCVFSSMEPSVSGKSVTWNMELTGQACTQTPPD
jgi:hypothetical protein